MMLAELQRMIDYPFSSLSVAMAPTMRRYAPAPKANRDDAATEAQHSGSET
jgi:hypothetical protein